jgi:hypothetical protein
VLWCLLAQGAILIDFCCPHVTWALPKLELRSVINLLPFFLPALAGSPFSGPCCHCLNVLWFRACHPGASCRGLAKRALVLCSSPRFVLPLNYVFFDYGYFFTSLELQCVSVTSFHLLLTFRFWVFLLYGSTLVLIWQFLGRDKDDGVRRSAVSGKKVCT